MQFVPRRIWAFRFECRGPGPRQEFLQCLVAVLFRLFIGDQNDHFDPIALTARESSQTQLAIVFDHGFCLKSLHRSTPSLEPTPFYSMVKYRSTSQGDTC